MKYAITKNLPIPADALECVKFKYPTIARRVGDHLPDGRRIVNVQPNRKSIIYRLTVG